MDLIIDKRLVKKFGEAIVEFANAQSEEEAFMAILNTMKELFNPPEKYIQIALNRIETAKITSTKTIEYQMYGHPFDIIKKRISEINQILIEIIKGSYLYNIKLLNNYIPILGWHDISYVFGNNKAQLKINYSISRIFLPEYENDNYDYTACRMLRTWIGVALFEYLSADKNNRFKIKRCPICNNFYISKNKSRLRCYSLECERTYQREKKRKYRYLNPISHP